MKLLRTIRLDPSDTFVFDRPAEPGEWAVTGTFMFADANLAALEGKTRTAFRAGFLGTASLGWSLGFEYGQTVKRPSFGGRTRGPWRIVEQVWGTRRFVRRRSRLTDNRGAV